MTWLVAASVGLILGSMVPIAPLRVLVATPLALLVPGRAVLLIAFDAAPPPILPTTALAALLSLATYPLLAVGLGLGGRSLSRQSVLATVVALVLVALATATCRGLAGRRGTSSATTMRGSCARKEHYPSLAYDTWMAACRRGSVGHASYVAVALAATALALATLQVLPQAPPRAYTAISLGGRWAHLDHVVPQTGPQVAIPLQVANHTGRAEVYRLRVDMDGRTVGTARALQLASGATWDGTVAATAARDGRLHRLRIAVASSIAQQALTLWVQSTSPQAIREPGSQAVPSPRHASRERTGGCASCAGITGADGSEPTPGQGDSPARTQSGHKGSRTRANRAAAGA